MLSYKRRKDVCSELSAMASELTSINDLPNETILKILSHIGPEDLCLNIAKVCKQWNILAKDRVLWKQLSYSCNDSSKISHIEEVLTHAPALHSLTIHKRKDVADILKFLNQIGGDLRKLMLKDCCLGEDGVGLLGNIVDLCPDLDALSLQNCSPLKAADYRFIPRLKKLSELDLSFSNGLSGETVRLIADGCQHLKKLIVEGVLLFRDDDVIHVINRLGKQLTALVFGGGHLTDVGFSYLKNCVRLQELQVHRCDNMTDRGLLEGIGSLHGLASLRLHICGNLTAQALSKFLHQHSMTSIVSLNLSSCNNLDDEGLKGIAERCIRLKELTVVWCDNVTDAGISIVVISCNHLRVLKLDGLKKITGGWMALVPSHLPHLRQLCLLMCHNVCDEYVQELVAAVPELKVMNRWGNIVGAVRNKHLEST